MLKSMEGKSLDGRHALITGGGTGIGAAAARALAGAGARLSLLGRRVEPLEQIAGEIGGRAFRCDVTDKASVEHAFAEAREAHGPVSILVVNAGVGDSAPFDRTPRETWDRIIATNLTSAFDCAQLALDDLLGSDNGRLIFVASVAGLRGAPYAAPYAASKHGMIGLMRSLAKEFAQSAMTVNAVCPGFVDTPMADETIARIARATGREADQARQAVAEMNASGRLVQPEAVAAMILTLCLPESRDVNGAAITIDGGSTA